TWMSPDTTTGPICSDSKSAKSSPARPGRRFTCDYSSLAMRWPDALRYAKRFDASNRCCLRPKRGLTSRTRTHAGSSVHTSLRLGDHALAGDVGQTRACTGLPVERKGG